MPIGGERLRTATWIADRAGNIVELHLIGRNKCIITLWDGDPAALDDIRRQFAECLGGFENNIYEAAGILLRLLLGTLSSAFEAIDMKLDGLRLALGGRTDAPDSAALAQRLQCDAAISSKSLLVQPLHGRSPRMRSNPSRCGGSEC
jgi:hypothetical protein